MLLTRLFNLLLRRKKENPPKVLQLPKIIDLSDPPKKNEEEGGFDTLYSPDPTDPAHPRKRWRKHTQFPLRKDPPAVLAAAKKLPSNHPTTQVPRSAEPGAPIAIVDVTNDITKKAEACAPVVDITNEVTKKEGQS